MAEEDVNFDLTAKKKKKKKKTPFDLDGLEGAEVSLNNLFFAADISQLAPVRIGQLNMF